jgi:hypothetical protein
LIAEKRCKQPAARKDKERIEVVHRKRELFPCDLLISRLGFDPVFKGVFLLYIMNIMSTEHTLNHFRKWLLEKVKNL